MGPNHSGEGQTHHADGAYMVEFIERMGMKKVEGREKMTFGNKSCGREERERDTERERGRERREVSPFKGTG